MQIRSVDPVDHAEWADLVRRCGGHGLHMPGVSLAEHDSSGIRGLVFEEDGECLACAVAVLATPGRLGRLRGRPTILLLPSAPALADAGAAAAVRAALLTQARELGAGRVVVQPGYSQWMSNDEDLAAWRTGAVTEFVLDLRIGHEELLGRMHKIHRKNVRRVRRAGLDLVEDSGLEGLLRLRAMQVASAQRAEEKTEGFGVRSEEFFRRLHRHVFEPGLGHILFAHLEGEPVAALAWIEAAGRVLTVRSGSVPLGYESRAMYLLHDELILRAIAGGAVELNIGGVPSAAREAEHPQSGLYEFKNGFGGQAIERFALDIPLSEIDG